MLLNNLFNHKIINKMLIIIILFIIIFTLSVFNKQISASNDYEQAFYNDVNNDGVDELLPYKYTKSVETTYYQLYTKDDLTYDKTYDPITYSIDIEKRNNYVNLISQYQKEYYNTYSNIINNPNLSNTELDKYNKDLDTILDKLYETKTLLNNLDNESEKIFNQEYNEWLVYQTSLLNKNNKVTLTEEQTLLYWLHVPFNYNPNNKKEYPVLITIGAENPTIDNNSYIDKQGNYLNNYYELSNSNEFNSFYTTWYNQALEDEKYDCFIISIVLNDEFFRGYREGIGINTLSYSSENNCYKLTNNTDNATYSNIYNSDILDTDYQIKLLGDLIDDLSIKYHLDSTRQYIMGYDVGAVLTDEMLNKYPDRFASAVMINPNTLDISVEKCKELTNTNIWCICGDSDNTCNKNISKAFIDKINNCRNLNNTGINKVSKISYYSGNHSYNNFNKNNIITTYGEQINNNLSIINFLFDSIKINDVKYLDITDYLWSDDYLTCTGVKYYTENGIKIPYGKTIKTTFVVDKQAECDINSYGHYEALFSKVDPSELGYLSFTDQSTEYSIIEIPNTAIGHSYYDISYSLSSDKQKCTASKVCKNNNNHKITETVDTTYHKISNANFLENEKGYYSAIFTNSEFKTHNSEITSKDNSSLHIKGVVALIAIVVILGIIVIINVTIKLRYDKKPIFARKK